MSSLNSDSSLQDILDAYDNNASWEEDSSVTKALAFVTAIRFLLRHAERERKGGTSGAEHQFNLELLREELKEARQFAVANRTDGSPSVIDVDFTEFDRRA